MANVKHFATTLEERQFIYGIDVLSVRSMPRIIESLTFLSHTKYIVIYYRHRDIDFVESLILYLVCSS